MNSCASSLLDSRAWCVLNSQTNILVARSLPGGISRFSAVKLDPRGSSFTAEGTGLLPLVTSTTESSAPVLKPLSMVQLNVT